MRNKKNKHLGIEIDPELHYKLHYISKYYGRSANGEILYLIRQEIKAFEKVEGEIFLTLDAASKAPQQIEYRLYDEIFEVKITSLAKSKSSPAKFDRSLYRDYEIIDFR